SSFASGGGGHPPGEKAARGGRNIMGAGPLKGGGKRALCLLWVASLLILSGCWDRKELNEIALIRAIGIDRTEDGQVEVTLLQAIPQRAEDAGGGGKNRGNAKGPFRPKHQYSRGKGEIAAKAGARNLHGSPRSGGVRGKNGPDGNQGGPGLHGTSAAGAVGCRGVRERFAEGDFHHHSAGGNHRLRIPLQAGESGGIHRDHRHAGAEGSDRRCEKHGHPGGEKNGKKVAVAGRGGRFPGGTDGRSSGSKKQRRLDVDPE